MKLIYGALGAVLMGTTGMAWHYGRELRDSRSEAVKLDAKLTTCKSELAIAEKATQDWAAIYETDMKAKDAEYAELSEQQSESAKNASRKQFDAGLRYGRAMYRNPPSVEPRGVLTDAEDFAVFIDGTTDRK